MTKPCSNPVCHSGKPVFAANLCSGCYSMRRRRGTLVRKNVVNRGSCIHPGCDLAAFAKNLCAKHYQQSRGYEATLWRTLRSRAPGAFPPEWNDFDTFVAAVGPRPSPKHQLRRPDPEIPWSVQNMVWRDPIEHGSSSGTPEEKALYYRAWDLRKKYNLSPEDVERMEIAQDGACPICTLPLRRLHPDTGRPVRICVDHDHRTRKVRSLLDDDCNKLLGMAKDDPATCRRAGDYLDFHKGTEND